MKSVNTTETLDATQKTWAPDRESSEFESPGQRHAGAGTAGEWIGKKAEVVSFDKVSKEEIGWLWPGHIPLGTLTLIAGDPGVGKSFLTLFMAAITSTGERWPGEQRTEDGGQRAENGGQRTDDGGQRTEDGVDPLLQNQGSDLSGTGGGMRIGSVIILNNEDSAERVIRPRLEALGADLSKIKTIPFVRHKDESGNEFTEYFNIITDLKELEAVVREAADTKMIIIDPLSAFFGCIDMHKDNYVRAIMTPITDMARKYNVAIVGVIHLNKGSSTKALYRTMGSLAFPAAARAVWLVSEVPNSPGDRRRLFMPVKQNMVEKAEAMAFTIKDNRVVFEKEAVNIPAEIALSPKSNMEAPERNRAIEWFKKILADGKEMPTNEVMKLAAAEGFSEKTLRKAREEIKIKCFQEFDNDGNRYWCMKLDVPVKIPGLGAQLKNRLMIENLQKSMFVKTAKV